jgi:hypothetical protein
MDRLRLRPINAAKNYFEPFVCYPDFVDDGALVMKQRFRTKSWH